MRTRVPLTTHVKSSSRVSGAAAAAEAAAPHIELTRMNARGERLYCVCNEPHDDDDDERAAVHCATCDDWCVT